MRKKQKKKIVLSVCVVMCIGLIVSLIFKLNSSPLQENQENITATSSDIYTNNEIRTKTDGVQNNADDIKDTPVVFSKSATFKVSKEEFTIQVTEHTTVYDAMNSLMSEGKMTFDGEEYPGLGFFVTQINSLESGGGKNLMYYVNDKEASLGVSTYVIKEGDIIEWKLK